MPSIPSPPASAPWPAAVAGMLALASSLGIGRFVYTPILPSMAAALDLGAGTAGLIASTNFVGYLAGAVAATARTLPGGPRAWFVGGLVISAATTIGMGWVDGLALFLLLRFLGGAASAFVLVLGTAAVLQTLAAAGRPRLGALHYAGIGVGIVLSAVLVATLEAAGAGWRPLWIGAGLVAAAMVPLPALVLRWPVGPGRAAGGATQLGRGMLSLSVCHFLFGLGYVVTATFLIAMVRASPGGRAVEPLIWTVVGLTAMPSLLLWLAAASRIGLRRAYAVAALLEAAGVLLAGGWPTGPGLLLGAALLGATFVGLTALGFAVASEFGADGQARRFAVITIGFGLGQAIGPALGGALTEWTGSFWTASALAASALLLASILIVAAGFRDSVRVP